MSWMNTRHCCSGVFLNETGSRKNLSLPWRGWNHSCCVQSITTGPVRLRSANALRWAITRSYGLSLRGGRSRSGTRSISTIDVVSFTRIFRCVFELLEAAPAIDRNALEPIRLGCDEFGGIVWIGIEMLHDDAVGTQRKVEHVAGLPGMLDAVDHRIALAVGDHHDLAALELQ